MNELLLLSIAILDLGLVLLMHRLGKKWLYSSIVVNLILISVFGAKLISIFGLVTNSGNVFYAAVFFATYLLIEHHGLSSGVNVVWLGVLSTTFFMVMSQFAAFTVGVGETAEINGAIHTLFTLAPRVALASLVAYVAAQSLNSLLYGGFKKRNGKDRLWLRALASSSVAQLLDSILFFSIAFLGIVPLAVMVQAMIIGYVVKVLVGAMSIPLLYLSYQIKR